MSWEGLQELLAEGDCYSKLVRAIDSIRPVGSLLGRVQLVTDGAEAYCTIGAGSVRLGIYKDGSILYHAHGGIPSPLSRGLESYAVDEYVRITARSIQTTWSSSPGIFSADQFLILLRRAATSFSKVYAGHPSSDQWGSQLPEWANREGFEAALRGIPLRAEQIEGKLHLTAEAPAQEDDEQPTVFRVVLAQEGPQDSSIVCSCGTSTSEQPTVSYSMYADRARVNETRVAHSEQNSSDREVLMALVSLLLGSLLGLMKMRAEVEGVAQAKRMARQADDKTGT